MPVAIWVIVAGLLTLFTAFMLTFWFRSISPVMGFLLLLFMTFLAVYEMGSFRSIWMAQVGEWGGVLRSLGISLPVRFLFVFLTLGAFTPNMSDQNRTILDVLLVMNIVSLVVELFGLVIVYSKKEAFMPSKEEVDAVMKRIQTTGVRTVSECPSCKGLVEPDWCSCPSCGTSLPRFCVKCNGAIGFHDLKCSSCGVDVIQSAALLNMIDTLKETAEMPASSETRSVRYARYGEVLLKGGRTEEAIEAYRKAIHFTQFVRKQTNFMVKMATVYENSGSHAEAMQMLDAALELDPEDWAGAKKAREVFLAPSSGPGSSCAAPSKA